MKGLSSKEKEKVAEGVIEVLKEMELYENMSVFYNGKEIRRSVDSEEVIDRKISDCIGEYAEGAEILIAYDGGMLYDVMNGSFGWSLYNSLMEKLEDRVLNEYGLRVEDVYGWASVLTLN